MFDGETPEAVPGKGERCRARLLIVRGLVRKPAGAGTSAAWQGENAPVLDAQLL